jgi:hypothetical protein
VRNKATAAKNKVKEVKKPQVIEARNKAKKA